MKNLATFYDHILELAKQEGVSTGEALEEAAGLGIAWVEVSYANAQAEYGWGSRPCPPFSTLAGTRT